MDTEEAECNAGEVFKMFKSGIFIKVLGVRGGGGGNTVIGGNIDIDEGNVYRAMNCGWTAVRRNKGNEKRVFFV